MRLTFIFSGEYFKSLAKSFTHSTKVSPENETGKLNSSLSKL